MYRVQLSGNAYLPDEEIGLHYQIHRGIGVHQKTIKIKKTFSGSYFCWGRTLDGIFSRYASARGIARSRFSD